MSGFPIEAKIERKSEIDIYRERYRDDPKFHKLVDTLYHSLISKRFKISELRGATAIAIEEYIRLMGRKEMR